MNGKGMKDPKLSTLKVSLLISISLFLITLSFKSFFYYVPFANGFNLLSSLQALTVLGWVLLVAAPPLFFSTAMPWSKSKLTLFFVSVSLWTVSTALIKVYTLATLGKIWAEYLTVYPVMIYFEWVAPAFYIWLGVQMYRMSQGPMVVQDVQGAQDAQVPSGASPISPQRSLFDD
jgi:hypothetical protein